METYFVHQIHFVIEAAARLAAHDAMERLFLSHGADTTWDALSARFVAEESGDTQHDVLHVDRIVEDENDARAESRLCRAPSLKRERHVQLMGAHEDPGRAAKQHGLDLSSSRDAAGHVDQLTQRRAKVHFVGSRPLDVPAETEQLRARRHSTGA